MKRHPFRTFPLVFGVILILLAGWAAFPSGDLLLFGFPRWLLPAVVMLVGMALVGSLFTSAAGDEQTLGDPSRVDQQEDTGLIHPGNGSGSRPTD